MTNTDFEITSNELNLIAKKISDSKRQAYSQNEGSDVLANFKSRE